MLERTDFDKHSQKITQWISDYFNSIEDFPVKSKVQPGDIIKQLPKSAPEQSEDIDAILADLDNIIMPGITHWQHPKFHAFFPANNSVESVYAEMITAAIGAQCMIWETSPAAAELEERIMEWMAQAMGLPSTFTGVIQDTASTATLAAILTAREKATGFKSNEEGVPQGLRVYCSTQTHSSIDKAVRIAGIGSKNLIKIGVDDKMAMQPELLRKALEEDIKNGLKPVCVIAALGTTGTVAIDPIQEIAEVCKEFGIWLHVDAAFAGSALFLEEYQHLAKGIEDVDSFVFNPHKWMFTNFDCSAYYVKDVDSLIRTFDILPEYLRTNTRGLVNDYRDWGVPLGRRFRALKLWFVIRSYGLEGIRKKLKTHIDLNREFIQWIKESEDFEICSEPILNFCTFRFNPSYLDIEQLNNVNEQLVSQLNASGKTYVSHTKIEGTYVIRFVVGQTYVNINHLQQVWQLIQRTAHSLINI